MGWRKWIAAAVEIGSAMLPGAFSKGAAKGAEILSREPEPQKPLVKVPEPVECIVPGGGCVATPNCSTRCKYRD